MKKLILALLMFVSLFVQAQTDSLEIKLQQYKALFEKGLITRVEYETLREKELGLVLKEEEKRDNARAHNFNVRIAPVFYGAVWNNFKDRYNTFSGRVTGAYEGGLHVEAGPLIEKRHAINIALGFEGALRRFQLPIYAHYHIQFLDKKVSPYLHVGFGYMLVRYIYAPNNFVNFNGFAAPLGIGAAFKLSSKMDMALSADYRLLCTIQKKETTSTQNPEQGGPVYNAYRFIHELGVRLQFIFH